MTGSPKVPDGDPLDLIAAHLNTRVTIGGADGTELTKQISKEDVLALVEVARTARETIHLLDECLWDERAWEDEELVALMERVRALHAAALARLDGGPE